MAENPKKSAILPEVEAVIPPERFKNLWRDAGINSLEALARAYRYQGDENGNINENTPGNTPADKTEQ